MIVFGTCVGGDGSKYRSGTLPTLEATKAPDDVVLSAPGVAGICRVYNEFLAHARERDDCEAVVLLHDDVELRDPRFREKILAAVAEPAVGIVGVAGGQGLPSLEWWEARRVAGRVEEPRGLIAYPVLEDDVDAVDGLLLALAPAAFRLLDFDQVAFPLYHGYDVDYCLQARARGLRVVTRELDLYHRTKGGFGNKAAFDAANASLAGKWPAMIRPYSPVDDVVHRARRAVRRRVGSLTGRRQAL